MSASTTISPTCASLVMNTVRPKGAGEDRASLKIAEDGQRRACDAHQGDAGPADDVLGARDPGPQLLRSDHDVDVEDGAKPDHGDGEVEIAYDKLQGPRQVGGRVRLHVLGDGPPVAASRVGDALRAELSAALRARVAGAARLAGLPGGVDRRLGSESEQVGRHQGDEETPQENEWTRRTTPWIR